MKTWRLARGASGLDALAFIDAEKPSPAAGEVLVRVRACSLNYRDQMIAVGRYLGGTIGEDITPLSDGAGDVEAVGPGVTRFQPGDRVAGTFFMHWPAGPSTPHIGPALGAPGAPGMLTQYMSLPESAVVRIADSLSYEEAATLPCAGVTAWNALCCGPRPVGPGQSVLILGTGGVSLLALAIAKAAGARVIATSSSDAKLERVKALGADATINYRTTPDWGAEAARLSGGGVDHVVEVGGAGTLQQSMAAVGHNGEIALIGVLTRAGETGPHALMFKAASLRGIFVGSAAMANDLNRAVDATGIKPVIDKVFPFAQARDAYDYQSSPDLFGKVVIRVD